MRGDVAELAFINLVSFLCYVVSLPRVAISTWCTKDQALGRPLTLLLLMLVICLTNGRFGLRCITEQCMNVSLINRALNPRLQVRKV